ncbi:hypothetical protein HDU91_006697 [Kappamyces sp. JEL0680]|nr:hypothetical protein HDU91_006697 [Kappamyces sp. JEL0680]
MSITKGHSSLPWSTMDLDRKSARKVCNLWSHFGVLNRIKSNQGQDVVWKAVTVPAARDVSTTRKTLSYQVEVYFYKHMAQALSRPSPAYLSSFVHRQEIHLFMSDLLPAYPRSIAELKLDHALLALDWLAAFHAVWFGEQSLGTTTMATAPGSDIGGVWEQGTYWYLDTRRDEWQQIPKQFQQLQLQAERIASECHPSTSAFLTLVHGDPKAENILWSRDQRACAMFDFQYVGTGLGAKDVAYLLTSSVDVAILDKHFDEMVGYYFEVFAKELARRGKSLNGYTLGQFTVHLEWCLLDFCRFMAGWGWWGNHSWAWEKSRHRLD